MCRISLGPIEWMTSGGVGRLDRPEQVLVVLDAVLGVVSALQHHLGRAEIDRLAAAAQDLLDRVRPALGVLRRPVEGAELARRDADVGVVDVAVDQVGDDAVRVATPADRVGRLAERVQRRVGVEQQRLLGRDPAAVRAPRCRMSASVAGSPICVTLLRVRGARHPTRADSITIQSVVEWGAAVRIAELSSRSGTSIPSIKFYLREGLLPAGYLDGSQPGRLRTRAPVPPAADPSDDRRRRTLGRRRPRGTGRGGHPRPADPHAARHRPRTRSLRPGGRDPDDPAWQAARAEVAEAARRHGWHVARPLAQPRPRGRRGRGLSATWDRRTCSA